MLVQHIRNLIRFCHIVGISVGSESGQDAPLYELHRRRAPAGIAHVGLRIMYDHRVRLFQQFHLMWIDVYAVSKQRLRTEGAVVHQAVHDAFPIFLQAVVQIFYPFRHMDMIADFIRFVRSCQLHSCIGNCKLCMHTHHTGDHICVIFQCITDKFRILHDRFSGFIHAITIRNLITEAGTHT